MKIEWNQYKGPYKRSVKDVPEQLEYLFTTDDPIEDVDQFLYSELSINIKHQYKIYNIVEPVLDALDNFLKRKKEFRYKLEVLHFLTYLFSEYLRDENTILITPIEYQFCAKPLSTEYPKEFSYYLKFKKLYFKHYSDELEQVDKNLKIFFDAALDGSLKTEHHIRQMVQAASENVQTINIGLIGLGLLKYKRRDFKSETNLQLLPNDFVDISLAINHLPYNKNRIAQLLRSNGDTGLLWCNGFASALAASSYLISVIDQSLNEQKEAVNKILESFQYLKDNYSVDEFEIDFPAHKFMLEDVSSIVYRNFLGKGKRTSKNDLTELQAFFYESLAKKYKIHTYSMLYAGLLPQGITKKEVAEIQDIYESYQ